MLNLFIILRLKTELREDLLMHFYYYILINEIGILPYSRRYVVFLPNAPPGCIFVLRRWFYLLNPQSRVGFFFPFFSFSGKTKKSGFFIKNKKKTFFFRFLLVLTVFFMVFIVFFFMLSIGFYWFSYVSHIYIYINLLFINRHDTLH